MTQITLKFIALLAMVLDHTAKVFLPTAAQVSWMGLTEVEPAKTIMVSLGRLAFPIFCWFSAEGCRRTRNLSRYALRLLIFGILSEIPFQLCFYGAYYRGLTVACHNVMFTLLLAVLAVWGAELLEKYGVNPLLAKLVTAVFAVRLGLYLETDYNGWGGALILGLYYLPNKKTRLWFLAAWLSVFYLIWHSWNGTSLSWLTGDRTQLYYWLGGMLSVLLLRCYHGRRGRRCKWLFYVFYPAHLLLLFWMVLIIAT